jgi:hypothetical protein
VKGRNFRHIAAIPLALSGSAPGTALAALPDVTVECSRLGPDQRDEFLARVRLLLRTAEPEALPARIHAECTEVAAAIVWEHGELERLPVEQGPNLVEALIDAVEERLSRTRAKPEPEPADPAVTRPRTTLELPPLEQVRPKPESDERTTPRSARTGPPSVGGLGFGLVIEHWQGPVSFGLGPRVEVGVGSGAFALMLCETLRLGLGDTSNALAFDTQGGIAWGAPFAPDHRVGLLLLGGAEWFSVFGGAGPNSQQTESTATVMLGGRVAQRLGSVGLWVGLDGLYRFSDLSFGQPIAVDLAPFTVFGSIGVTLLVDSGTR